MPGLMNPDLTGMIALSALLYEQLLPSDQYRIKVHTIAGRISPLYQLFLSALYSCF
ncbi:MAG: hypothetical protein J7M30_04285 [Deltaproteobacteria bacterium]|nr:hypothetical protein [Deltaproteobacteria bacterium]